MHRRGRSLQGKRTNEDGSRGIGRALSSDLTQIKAAEVGPAILKVDELQAAVLQLHDVGMQQVVVAKHDWGLQRSYCALHGTARSSTSSSCSCARRSADSGCEYMCTQTIGRGHSKRLP